MINYLEITTWKGYLCFKLQRDDMGNLFKDGPKYVAFRNGNLVGEYSTQTGAEQGFLRGDSRPIRLKDYLGIDNRLRGG
jgi:hypothetical protein